MAPELAISALENLPSGAVVLDPMAGSGVVIRQAVEHTHKAIGYDLDPLAVLMSNVWASPIEAGRLEEFAATVLVKAQDLSASIEDLPWMCPKTKEFINFWFAEPQATQLATVSRVVYDLSGKKLDREQKTLLNAFRLSLSRVIVTKSGGASLASDTSHSRPHRTRTETDFDVYDGIEAAARKIDKICSEVPSTANAIVRHGDARDLRGVKSESVDAIVTSPPYLNAIDYMRGHKLSLVWLGYPISALSAIRSTSIGAESAKRLALSRADAELVLEDMIGDGELSSRHRGMVDRYIGDLNKLAMRCVRVLKPGGLGTFVIGNSCLKGTFISNSNCFRRLAQRHGLTLIEETERELPENRRYLPVSGKNDNPLQKRMRTETILTFEKVA